MTRAARPFARLLVPTDFSPSGDAAVALARERFPDAERLLFHALDPRRLAEGLTSPTASRQERDASVEEQLVRLRALAVPGEACEVGIGTAAEAILERARAWDADLIVMGTHGRTGLAHFLDGSVAEAVVRRARRPVLITHEQQDEAG